jgi:hypothetical protein
MSFSQKIITVFVGIAVALIAAGCGSSSNSPSLTKAEFIKQGDALCKKIEKERQTNIETFIRQSADPKKPLDKKQVGELALKAALPPLRHEAEELRALGVPSEPQATEIIEEFEKASDKFEENAKSGRGETVDPFNNAQLRARTYGFKSCIIYL